MPCKTSAAPADIDARLTDLTRYGLAVLGPVGAAGAQFLLSLALVRLLDPDGFGRFALLLIVAQFSWGIWSALFCAPLPRVLSDPDNALRAAALSGVKRASFFCAILTLPVFFLTAFWLGEPWAAALAFAGFVTAGQLRWFARALAYALGKQVQAIASDMLYASILLGGTAWLFFSREAEPTAIYGMLAFTTLLALAPFGVSWFQSGPRGEGWQTLKAYHPVWSDYARWSLIGVVSSELTANAHAYMVALLVGPAAFAPIAATALLIRPISVATNALIEFERARMASLAGQDGARSLVARIGFFRLMIVLIVIVTAAVSAALLWLRPHLVFPAAYGPELLALGALLWTAAISARVLPFPESALLQAVGAFRPLAITGLWSAALSCLAVAALLIVAPPIWSIAGVFLGQMLGAILIWREARRWLAAARATGRGPADVAVHGGERAQ